MAVQTRAHWCGDGTWTSPPLLAITLAAIGVQTNLLQGNCPVNCPTIGQQLANRSGRAGPVQLAALQKYDRLESNGQIYSLSQSGLDCPPDTRKFLEWSRYPNSADGSKRQLLLPPGRNVGCPYKIPTMARFRVGADVPGHRLDVHKAPVQVRIQLI